MKEHLEKREKQNDDGRKRKKTHHRRERHSGKNFEQERQKKKKSGKVNLGRQRKRTHLTKCNTERKSQMMTDIM